MTSTAPVQQQMVAELERGGVTAAVAWTAAMGSESNEGGRSSGVRLLDGWLAREFTPLDVRRVTYTVRLRNGLWRQE